MVVDCLIMSPQLAFVWWQNENDSPYKKTKKQKKFFFFFFFRETPTYPWVPFRAKFRPLWRLFRPSCPLAWSLPYDKINDFPTWDPNTSLSFLTSIVGMSTEMKIEEAMYLPNKTYQDHKLKIVVKKN